MESEKIQRDRGTNPIGEQQRETLASAAEEIEVTKEEQNTGTTARQSLRTLGGKNCNEGGEKLKGNEVKLRGSGTEMDITEVKNQGSWKETRIL